MIVAYIRRWWHCWMFSNHQAFSIFKDGHRITVIACSCGKIFWVDDHVKITPQDILTIVKDIRS